MPTVEFLLDSERTQHRITQNLLNGQGAYVAHLTEQNTMLRKKMLHWRRLALRRTRLTPEVKAALAVVHEALK